MPYPASPVDSKYCTSLGETIYIKGLTPKKSCEKQSVDNRNNTDYGRYYVWSDISEYICSRPRSNNAYVEMWLWLIKSLGWHL